MKSAMACFTSGVTFCLITIGIMGSASGLAADCLTAPAGLVGWWPADGHARDLSANLNHATSQSVFYNPGKVSSSFSFHDASRLFAPSAPSLSVSNITLAAWINPRDGAYRPIMNYQRDFTFRGVLFWTGQYGGAETAGSIYANLRKGPGEEFILEVPNIIPSNQWTFVAVTFDHTTGAARLYVNNQIVKTGTVPAGHTIDTVGPFWIGHCPSTSSDVFAGTTFNGSIDEPMVFDRALTEAEILQIFAAGSAGLCRDAVAPQEFSLRDPVLLATNNLVAAYGLNGDAFDSSGHGFHGTMHGTTGVADRFNRPSGAIRISGTNDYIDLGNRPEFNFTNGFTLNAWVKAEQAPGGYIIGKYRYNGPGNIESYSYGLGTHDFFGPYGFVLGDGVIYKDIVAGPNLLDDRWHALTLTFEDGLGIRLYVDGAQQGSQAMDDLPPLTNNLPLLIGKITSGLPFVGSIDDVSIYDRPLSDYEVQLLHNFQRHYDTEVPVLLQQATATFSQADYGDFSVARAGDGIIDSITAWGIYPNITNQTAVFETAEDVGYLGGTVLSFNLVFNHPSVFGSTTHTLGRFRLSATTDSRDAFADGMQTGGDVTANWSNLNILSASASSGATFTILPDNSLLVTGAVANLDTYTVNVSTRLTGITGIRLEVLTDPSLPFNGPGREPLNGNFALSELLVAARPGGAPYITNQIPSITVTNGNTAELTVGAASALPISYQWFLNGVLLTNTTNATLTIQNADASHAGTYTVQLSNAEGFSFSDGTALFVVPADSSALAAVNISNATPVNAPISDIFGERLEGADFLAQVYAGPSANSLTAQSPSVPFFSGEDAGFFIPITALLTNVVQGSNAFVQVRVWETSAGSGYEQASQNGGQFGASAVLETPTGGGTNTIPQLDGLTAFSLAAAPRIVVPPASLSLFVSQDAQFTAEIWGSGPFSYRWFLNNDLVATTPTLTLTNVQLEHSGEVYVLVSNEVGAATSIVATLSVEIPDTTPPVINITSPTAGTTHDSAVTLSGTITDNKGILSAAWSRNGIFGSTLHLTNGQFSVSVPLARGVNVIRVSATDTTNNISFATVTVTNLAARTISVGQIQPHQEGARVEVPLFLESRGDVAGLTYTLDLGFQDRNTLVEPEIRWESAIQGAVTSFNTNIIGQVRGNFALSGSALPTGLVHFATIIYRSRSISASRTLPLNLSLISLFNPNGNPVSPAGTDVIDGSVRINVRKIVGDNNANDRLDVGDAATIMRFDSRIEIPQPWDRAKNDLNNTLDIDAGDVIRVLRTVVGLDPQPSLPPPPPFGAAWLRTLSTGSGRITLEIDKPNAAPGEIVNVIARLNGNTKALAAASFRLQFPTNALRLENNAAHAIGPIVPSSAAVLWNIAPAQNDYLAQNGSLSVAISADRAWTTNNGPIAQFTFVVQPGATNQHRWLLALEAAELSNGFDLIQAMGGEVAFIGREAVVPEFNTNPAITEEGVNLTFATEVGLQYRIEVSEDLVNWEPITTIISTGSSLSFTDETPKESARRFYRAVQTDN
jgi:hypothetical protein